MSVDLAKRLGVVEAHDLGLQLAPDGEGGEVLAYTTVAFPRCEKCRELGTVVSRLDRRIPLEMPMPDLGAYRLNHDFEAVQAAKARHVCTPAPDGARPTT
jgi:hypothetical protein